MVCFTQNSNLTLATGTLSQASLKAKSSQNSLNFGVSTSISESSWQKKDENGKNVNESYLTGTTSISLASQTAGNLDKSYSVIGTGDVKVSGTTLDALQQKAANGETSDTDTLALATLKRNANEANSNLANFNVSTEASGSIDHRFFSEGGRNEIKEQFKQASQKVSNALNALKSKTPVSLNYISDEMKNAIATDKDASVLLMKELFDGLSSEQREDLADSLFGGRYRVDDDSVSKHNVAKTTKIQQGDIDFLNSLGKVDFDDLSPSEQRQVERIFENYNLSDDYKRSLSTKAMDIANMISARDDIKNGIRNYEKMSVTEQQSFLNKACSMVADEMGMSGKAFVVRFSDHKELANYVGSKGVTVSVNKGKDYLSVVDFGRVTNVYDGFNSCGHECMHYKINTDRSTSGEMAFIKAGENIG